MEIRDYLRAIRRWIWLPILLPIVAAGLTGFLLERQPSQYQADATVIVPAVSAKGFSTSAAAQYVATFKDVLVSQPVVTAVSRKTGVPTKELVTGLSANTITASSNIIHVTFLGTRGTNAAAVVREATVDTLDAVAQPQLIQAQNAVASAQSQLQQANAAMTQWTATTGVILPQQEFNTHEQELNQLLLQLQQAKLANDTQRAAALQGIITQREAQLATLATQVTQFTDLNDATTSALSVRNHAAQQLTDAQALVSADRNAGTVTVQDIGRVSKLADTLKFTGIAFAVALILVLGLVLIMELMRAGRRSGATTRPAHDAPSKAPAAEIPVPATPSEAALDPWRSAPVAQARPVRPRSLTLKPPEPIVSPATPDATAPSETVAAGGHGEASSNGDAGSNGNSHAGGDGSDADPQAGRGPLRRK